MRRTAKILKIAPLTVKRKLDYLSRISRKEHLELLEKIKEYKIHEIQIDDLITIEHTKLKPLSVSIAVDANRRIILGAVVSQIPSFGHLARISKKKYGKRKSHHQEGLTALFEQIKNVVAPKGIIVSDEHNLYPVFVKKYFPKVNHITHPSAKGAVTGQGELKKIFFDPLFIINHTCAMFRANINRLIRRTWSTTKDPKELQKHINVFISYYNSTLIRHPYQ
jgi:hypothetical protein